MKALLDTHVFLWWLLDDPRLSERARSLMADDATTLYLSAASVWEMAIKAGLGKLAAPKGDLGRIVAVEMERQRIAGLAVEHAHAWQVSSLPSHHRDPFDRVLVAQGQVERLAILTGDPWIARYDVETIW